MPTGSSAIPLVSVVDDDASVQEALASLFRSAGWKIRSFAAGREFLKYPRTVTPGCLILDVALPDIDGLELQRHVAGNPELPVIFLTGRHDVLTTVRAMKAGAFEFLTKPADSEHLLSAVQSAIEYSTHLIARKTEIETLRERHGTLTRREKEVMDLVVAGYSNKRVGAALAISEITVKAHRGKVMRKMQAESFAHLIGMAAQIHSAVASKASSDLGIPGPILPPLLYSTPGYSSTRLI